MPTVESEPRAPSAADIEQFIDQGFLRIDDAFSREVADEARAILWRATGCDPDRPETWTKPVIRLDQFYDPPFVTAANTPVLRAAFDALVGPGRWRPRGSLGTFPVRFPSADDPGDGGWHVDMSFGGSPDDFLSWRANVASRGRALLMLFLFSNVDEEDAPTRIRAGSHRDIARRLAPLGDEGLSLRELAADGFAETESRPERFATGPAGTVYLCHPFLVHAAQPPLEPEGSLSLERPDGDRSPVEEAIRRAI